MSIKGRYVKGVNVTEVEIAAPEIKRELHSFNWKSKPKETFRRYEGITLPNAILLGVSCGLTCGSLLASAVAFEDWPFRMLMIGTLILDALIVAENLTKEVER